VRTITPVGYDPSEDEDPELIDGPAQDAIHDAICALPPPSDAMAALAEVVRVAVEKEREACIAIANERGAWASNDADAESLVDRLEANGRMDMAKEIAAAIRARSTEGGA
jgi:hypothetical protein